MIINYKFLVEWGGVRPITVGCTLFHLAAKVYCSTLQESNALTPCPSPVGYGTSQGAAAAMPAAHIYVPWQSTSRSYAPELLDFSNAFRFVRWDQMLILVGELAPELLPFVHSADSASSTLFWDETPLQWTDGVQQGDPLPCCSVLLSIC